MKSTGKSRFLFSLPAAARGTAVFLILVFTLMSGDVLAANQKEAADVADKCIFKVSVSRETRDQIRTASLKNWWNGGTDGMLTVTLPGSKTAQGIMLSFFRYVPSILLSPPGASIPLKV